MSGVSPSMDHLTIASKKLMIHGVDLNYSKQGFTSAKFNKFNFATSTDAAVNLIVPNGYEYTENEENAEQFKNKALGFHLLTVNNALFQYATIFQNFSNKFFCLKIVYLFFSDEGCLNFHT